MAARAVVTGACGFNGSHMVDHLIDRGYKVIATDLDHVDKTYLNPEAEFIPADITDINSLKKVFKNIDYVFHPASILDYSSPIEYVKKINVYGTENLCQISLETGVKRLILWSSYTVYGNWQDTSKEITESSPKSSKSFYEVSNWYKEQIAFRYVKRGLPCTTIRPVPIYGPRNAHGIAAFIFLMSPFSAIPLPLSMTNLLPSVHISDVVRAALFLVDKEIAIGKAYNLVDDASYSLRELLEFIASNLGTIAFPVLVSPQLMAKIALRFSEDGDIRQLPGERKELVWKHIRYLLKVNLNISNQRIKNLGFSFNYPDPKPGLAETIQWYYKNKWITKDKLYYKISNWLIKPMKEVI